MKGQVSLEFIIVIAVILTVSVFFANLVFDSVDSTKSVAKIKLRTLDLITINDSNAQLLKIVQNTKDYNLNLDLYLRGGEPLHLTDSNYTEVIELIISTTNYKNVNLSFEYTN